MDRSGSAVRTELLEFQLRCAFGNADISAIIPAAALGALQPHIFTFTFLLGHIFNLFAGRASNFQPRLTRAQLQENYPPNHKPYLSGRP
jgi:hypothetical protein